MKNVKKDRIVSGLRIHLAGMSGHFKKATRFRSRDAVVLDRRQLKRLQRAEAYYPKKLGIV